MGLSDMIQVAKFTAIVAISAVFLLAINTIIGILGAWVNTTFMGEFFHMVSMYLPFNAGTVFSGILLTCFGILAFKVAKKTYDLVTWSINSV